MQNFDNEHVILDQEQKHNLSCNPMFRWKLYGIEPKYDSWNNFDRDDFMLGAKMKDWDQESDGD